MTIILLIIFLISLKISGTESTQLNDFEKLSIEQGLLDTSI